MLGNSLQRRVVGYAVRKMPGAVGPSVPLESPDRLPKALNVLRT